MSDDTVPAVVVVVGMGLVGSTILGLFFAVPAWSRYQDRENAENAVNVSRTRIQNTVQLVEIEKQKAEVRVQEAKGIAESQRIIDTSLTTNYLTYLAIKAQEEMAHSPNHTQIYIPTGNNGIPLMKTLP